MCSLCRLPVAKNHNFGQILTFGGILYRPPIADESQIWCATADPQLTYVSKFISIGLFYRPLAAKNPNLCRFWTSAFSDVDSWQQSEKVEHGCTTTNLPLSNGIEIISVFQHLHGEIERTNSDVQKRDGLTKTTKKNNVFRHPGG